MRRFITATLTLSLFTLSVFAQSTSGRLIGSVSGPDGVIPGATVTATDNQTGKVLTVQASGDGAFVIPQMEFGTYTVTVTAPGFKTFTATELKIDAGREYTLNPTLEIGSLQETVTVVAGADVLNAANAELSTTVSPRQILELPIDGRNPLALLNLQAGVNPISNSINGQRSSSANFNRDGINIQDNFIRTGGFVQDRPTVDDTGEFTVITQNAGAELGGGGSTQVQLVTPRGQSDFHGALFAFNRNSKFAANEFFSNAARPAVERPFLNRNQFGGKVSGPVVLPRFGSGGPGVIRGKAFFFVAYEKFLLRLQTPVQRTLLREQARNGTFTYTALADDPAFGVTTGQQVTVNVLTGQGLNLTTAARQTSFVAAGGALTVDPVIQSRILANMPAVGNSTITNSGVTQLLRFNQSNNDDRNSLTGRFDVDVNDNHNFNFVYKYNDNDDERVNTDGGGFGTNPFVTQSGPTTLYIGSYRATLGHRLVNEVRAAYQRSEPFFNQGPVPTDFLIFGAAGAAPNGVLPLGVSNPEATFMAQGRNTDLYVLQDNASYTAGNHSFRFGGQFEAHRIQSHSRFDTTPTFNITTVNNVNTPRLATNVFPGGISNTERGVADNLRYFLGGIVGGGIVAANFDPQVGPVIGAPAIQQLNFETYGLYVSDQWRVTPRLTFNFGLRYDLFTPVTNPDQVFLEPVIPPGSDMIAAITDPNGTYDFVGRNAGSPGRFFKTDKNNFGPSFSFAYSPEFKNKFLAGLMGSEGRTVIRGGFRVGYINDEFVRSADNAAAGNEGLNQVINAVDPATNSTAFSNQIRFGRGNLPGFRSPIQPTLPLTFAQANINDGTFFNTVFAVDPNMQLQRNYEYNFSIQREIGSQTAIEIRYVGGHSNSLVRGFDFNQLNIRDTGFLADFLRARENCRLQGATIAGVGDPLLRCTNAAFNPSIPGSQPLPVFAQLPFGAFLNNGTVLTDIIAGEPADLALTYILNGLDIDENGNGVQFRRNRHAGVVDLLTNGGRFRFNSLQAEIRRRFSRGLSFQANYTFQKILTDIPRDGQDRFDPFLDFENKDLEYSRPDFDRTHTVNFNAIYELPFGRNKRFLNGSGVLDKLLGGFQVSSIINISSGAPISIRDIGRGTLNRAGRSGRQTANSSLSPDQIRDLIGIHRTPCGIFFIDPSVININPTALAAGNCGQLTGGGFDGTATGGNLNNAPTAAFPGQVFFRVPPGQTGTLPRAFINGPIFFNWNAGLIKNISFTERTRLQLRAEAFNVLNRANFVVTAPGALGENSNIFNINSSTFGRITNNFDPRIMQFAVRFEF